jgi:hypothetical protein
MMAEGLAVDFCICFAGGSGLSDLNGEFVAVARGFSFFKVCLGVVLFILKYTWFFFSFRFLSIEVTHPVSDSINYFKGASATPGLANAPA